MKLKIYLVSIYFGLCTLHSFAEDIQINQIDVYSATPLPSIGLPVNMVPSAVQIVTSEEVVEQSGVSIADYMVNNLQGVTVNEVGGNPYQVELNYRGYNATPIAGNPQGLSIYIDGIRANQPFSNNVLWDLIPNFAIEDMQLVGGSNPVYGLNTLGGSMSMQTKSGRTFNKSALDILVGSWGRHVGLVESGGISEDGQFDYYLGYEYFEEDGWRDFSPTYVNQWFSKGGWDTDTSRFEVSYTGAHNKLIGNGLTPKDLLGSDNEGIHTLEDQTRNDYGQLSLNGMHFIDDMTMASGNVYWRRLDQSTSNGDLDDDWEEAGDSEGSLNRTITKQDAYGANGQLTFDSDWIGRINQLIVGASYEYSLVKFRQSTQEIETLLSSGFFGGSLGTETQTTGLKGKTETYGLFVTNTHALTETLSLNTAIRYNYVTIDNKDTFNAPGAAASLTSEHDYDRLNPSIGLIFSPTENYSTYASYSESSRAPTSIELGCSNPDQPCNLPTQMADDPPLDQVVAKTVEIGARGQLNNFLTWNFAAYDAINHDDILFIYANASNAAGYFTNVSKTTRQGVDLGLATQFDKLSLDFSYGYIAARYGSDFTMVSEVNSSAGAGSAIQVKDGDYLPNIPKHNFKIRAKYQLQPAWYLGATATTFSSSFMMGNENQKHNESNGVQGEVPGYTAVNLDSAYHFSGTLNGLKLYAKLINVFDNEYYTGGRMAQTFVQKDRTFGAERDVASLVPGAPRAGWIGLRYEF